MITLCHCVSALETAIYFFILCNPRFKAYFLSSETAREPIDRLTHYLVGKVNVKTSLTWQVLTGEP